jgi:hypothetical protein
VDPGGASRLGFFYAPITRWLFPPDRATDVAASGHVVLPRIDRRLLHERLIRRRAAIGSSMSANQARAFEHDQWVLSGFILVLEFLAVSGRL